VLCGPILPPRLITPPAANAWPVSLAQARDHLRLGDESDDAVLQRSLNAACQFLDGWTGALGRCIAVQTWAQPFARFSDEGLRLCLWPVTAIVSVTYRDEAGATQTLAPAAYELDAAGDRALVLPAGTGTFPATGAGRSAPVTVTFTAGQSPAEVPASIVELILLLTAHWYENRAAASFGGGFGQLPMGADALIQQSKRLML
jgi:uncharacterized phiE125 gp8 family phage protein